MPLNCEPDASYHTRLCTEQPSVLELAEMFPAGIYAIGVVGMATSSLSRVTSALAAAGSARQMQAHRHSARRAVRRFFMLLRM